MDSVFSWAILSVVGIVYIVKFLLSFPTETKKYNYWTEKTTADFIYKNSNNKKYY